MLSCSNCGRPARYKRRKRRGRYSAKQDHDLCRQCWQALTSHRKATELNMDNISILTDPWLKEVIPWIEEVRQTGETFLKSVPKYDVDTPARPDLSISASAGN